jgi:hypothetical protein
LSTIEAVVQALNVLEGASRFGRFERSMAR